jgi:HAD superfamily hydrolase (TIGR01484 family)
MSVKLVAFDLDGTLAPSKGFISLEMAYSLSMLLSSTQVCIITGGTKKQILSQVVKKLPKGANLKNLSIMPTSGASYLKPGLFGWKPVYSLKLKRREIRRINRVVKASAILLGYWPTESYGKTIDNRGAQITFSGLGQKAPGYLKDSWDKNGDKKKKLKSKISGYLPEFEVRSGGSTSIDITKKGVDKGFAVLELIRLNSLNTEEVVFVGDRLDKDGNDFPVLQTGVRCIEVKTPWQTLGVISDLLKSL